MRAAEVRKYKTQAARAYGAAEAAGLKVYGGPGYGGGAGGGLLARRGRLPKSVIDRPPDRYRRLMDKR